MAEDAGLVERLAARRREIGGDVRPRGDARVQVDEARQRRFEPRHRVRERVAQAGDELEQRQVDVTERIADRPAGTAAVAREDLLEAYEVSPAVNRADNDGLELIAPVAAEPPTADADAPAERQKKPKTDERQWSLF